MSLKSFLDRNSTNNDGPSHARAKRQEKEVAKRTGGQQVPGSGSGKVKGDVRVPKLYRIECKTTKHKSFSVTLDMVNKIEEAAIASGEIPMIIVEFNDGKGKKIKEVAVLPTYMLDKL